MGNRRPYWSIRQRPEILATLYQLGFEKSEPKPNPRPNRFGERVLEVYESPWMREHFGPRSGAYLPARVPGEATGEVETGRDGLTARFTWPSPRDRSKIVSARSEFGADVACHR